MHMGMLYKYLLLPLQGIDKFVESFLILNAEERKQLRKKRASKSRKRMRAEGKYICTFCLLRVVW